MNSHWRQALLGLFMSMLLAVDCQFAFAQTASGCARRLLPTPGAAAAEWNEYLAQQPHQHSQPAFSTSFPTETLGRNPLEDSRMYLLHARRENQSVKIDSEYQRDVQEAQVGFRILSQRSSYFAGTLYVVQADDGKTFSTSLALRRRDFASSQEYRTALYNQMAHIKHLVDQGVQNRDLDFYFELVNKGYFSVKNDFDVKCGPQAKCSVKYPIERLDRDHYRYVTREYEIKGDIVVSTIDTVIERLPLDSFARPIEPDAAELERGQQRHIQWLNEIARELYPRYASERGWSQEFIDSDYQKLMANRNLTRYVLVQARNQDGTEGQFLAILGLNRAPYGTVTYYDGKAQQWKKKVGGIWRNLSTRRLEPLCDSARFESFFPFW